MIREVTLGNLTAVVNDVADSWLKEYPNFGGLDRGHFLSVWRRFLSGAPEMTITYAYFVNEKPVGVIFGLVIPDDVTGELKAVESHWLVSREHRGSGAGLRLLRAFEKSAKSKGAVRVICGSYRSENPERMRSIYERLGYNQYAEAFTKGCSVQPIGG